MSLLFFFACYTESILQYIASGMAAHKTAIRGFSPYPQFLQRYFILAGHLEPDDPVGVGAAIQRSEEEEDHQPEFIRDP